MTELWQVAFPNQAAQTTHEQPWLQQTAQAQAELLRAANGGDEEDEDERTQVLTPLPIVSATGPQRLVQTPLPLPSTNHPNPNAEAHTSAPRENLTTLPGITATSQPLPQVAQPSPALLVPPQRATTNENVRSGTGSPLRPFAGAAALKDAQKRPAPGLSALPKTAAIGTAAVANTTPGVALPNQGPRQGFAVGRGEKTGFASLPKIQSPGAPATPSRPVTPPPATSSVGKPALLSTHNARETESVAVETHGVRYPSAAHPAANGAGLAVPRDEVDDEEERTRILGSNAVLSPRQPATARTAASSVTIPAPQLAGPSEGGQALDRLKDDDFPATLPPPPKASPVAHDVARLAEVELPSSPLVDDGDPAELMEEDGDDHSLPVRQIAQPRPLALEAPRHSARPNQSTGGPPNAKPIISQPPKPITQGVSPSIVLRAEPLVHQEATRPAIRAVRPRGVIQLTYGTLVIGALAIALLVLSLVLWLK